MELVSVIKILCGKWGLDISKDKEWMKMHLALLKEIEEQSNVTLDIVVKNDVYINTNFHVAEIPFEWY